MEPKTAKEKNIQQIESSKYQEELIQALSTGEQPKYFYKVDEDIFPAHSLPEDEQEELLDKYRPDAGSGLPAFIVSDQPLTLEEKKALAKELSERVS